MAPALSILLAAILVISFLASAQEVAYYYGGSGSQSLGYGNITEYNGTDMVTSVVASADINSKPSMKMFAKTVDEMKEEINIKLNVDNPAVEDKGSSLILDYPGDGTINQICSIYEYMVGNWSYKRDQRGIEVLQYSNKSLENGEGRYSGQGDCDDFAILLASLIESIGGTSRIILAYGPNGGHAYTEVYLGTFSGPECDVERMLNWLKKKYDVKEINYHTDLKTGDVWLNLDWWKDPNTGTELAKHPGGPLFRSTNNTPISIKEGYPKVPLTPLNDPPSAQFSVSLEVPDEGENIAFNASKSKDLGGKIVAYNWDFGDGNGTGRLSTPEIIHSYSQSGSYTVTLTVEDNEDAASTSTRNITINSLPHANFTIMPEHPAVGAQVRFDASGSWDEEDGKNLAYHWEINKKSAIFNLVSPPKQVYDEAGMYWVNLTVSDTNGAVGHKNYLLKINRPPVARISFDSANLSLGKAINFTAELSEDPDGEIISYTWDFGDNSTVDHNKTTFHRFHDGGNKTVRLSITDNDGAISNISQVVSINYPPIAKFSSAPLEPEKGDLVSFDASGSYDPDGKVQRYLWDFGVGKAEPEIYYSELAEHTYNRPARYNITLTVVDDRDAAASISKMIEVKSVNKKPIADILEPDKKSPQMVGSIITWTAQASDEEGDPLQYRFLLDDQVKQNWSESPVWRWTISDEKVGSHRIEAIVRDGKHDSEGDSSKAVDFEVIPLTPEGIATGRSSSNDPPVLTGLYPEMWLAPGVAGIAKMSGPLQAGNTVFWTAEASDPEDDPLQFQFSLDGKVVQNWSKGFAWNWTPTNEQVGNHIIEAKVRDGNHAGPASSDDGKTLNFVVSNPAPDSGKQESSSDSVETLTNFGHYYTGITLNPSAGSNATVALTGTGPRTSHPTTNITSIAKYNTTSIIGSIRNASPYIIVIGEILKVASDYYLQSPCLSCNNVTDIGSSTMYSNNSTFWLNKGDELFALSRCDDAILAYNKSYVQDPRNAKPLFGKGRAFFAKGNYDEALIWLTAAVELSPQYKLSNSAYADMWIYRGNALRKLGRNVEADAAFDKAEDLDPSRHPDLEAVVESCAGAAPSGV